MLPSTSRGRRRSHGPYTRRVSQLIRFVRPGAMLAVALLSAAGLAASGAPTPGTSHPGPLRPGAAGGTSGPALTPTSRGPAHAVVVAAGRHDRSAPLRSVVPRAPEHGDQDPDAAEPQPLPGRSTATPPAAVRDPVLQAAVAVAAAPSLGLNIEGVNNVNGVLPPDTNGDIGPNDYVQWVNLSFAIYDRSGTRLYGPAAGKTLWAGFGGPCEGTNDGDPIAQYDHLADRWVMTQFALPNYPSGPFYQCFAVSTTGDPLGAWNRYEFKISDTKLNDYPHLGVWPDAYYLSINQFSGNSWAGAGAVAFDRAAMLAGDPATMQYVDLFGVDPNLGGMLPSDLDGPAPPAGAPNIYAEADDNANGYPQDQVDLWSFHVDWANAANTTFTHTGALKTAAFDSNLCNYSRNCIPQPGNPPRGLDALSDRLMYRLQYRNFGDHQSLVLNHTVDVDGKDRAGIRWYELRKTTSAWSIYQQGTYSPDSTDRWLGSAAMDGNGNIGLGYSVSSGSVAPSIRYTGRLAGDPLGTLGLGEGTIVAGSGSQSSTAYRWGDYAMLAVDPTDDCTFWFTSEYYKTSGNATWQTRIASFRMAGCGPDTTPPSVSSFAPTTTSPTNAATISYALAFDAPVTGLAASDFTLGGTATGCAVGAPSGSGASYAIAVSGCSEGSVALTLKANSVADLATNIGPTSSAAAANVTIDRTAPSAALSCATPSPTNATSISCSVTFSETVAGGSAFTAGDVSRTGTSTTWTVGSPTGSGPYTFSVTQGTPRADGTVTLQVVAGAVKDAAGNSSTASSSVTKTIDQTAPTTALGGSPAPGTTAATSIAVTATFSESVSGFTAGDVTLGGTSNAATPWTVGAVSGGPTIYTFTVSAANPADGSLTIGVPAGGATDAAGNGNTTSNTLSYTVDRASPSAALARPASPTNVATLGYGVTFSESVSGLVAADFTLGGTATGCLVGTPSGAGASYTVNVTGCSSGTVILTLKAGSVVDAGGTAGPASDVTAATVTIDRTAPTTSVPLTGLRSGATFSSSLLAARVTWTGSDAGGAGVATFDIERSVDGAAFAVVATGLASAVYDTKLTVGHTYRFAVRAHDAAGNVGGWIAGATSGSVVRQDTSGYLVYAGTWHAATYASFSGGSVRYSGVAGASAKLSFSGRSIAVVSTLAATRGAVKVYLDGVLVATVDTYSPTTAYRRVIWSRTFSSYASHTIKLVVVGTAGRPRFDLDAFLVLK